MFESKLFLDKDTILIQCLEHSIGIQCLLAARLKKITEGVIQVNLNHSVIIYLVSK